VLLRKLVKGGPQVEPAPEGKRRCDFCWRAFYKDAPTTIESTAALPCGPRWSS